MHFGTDLSSWGSSESVGPGCPRHTSPHTILVRLNSTFWRELQEGQELNQRAAEAALGTPYCLTIARSSLRKLLSFMFISPEGRGGEEWRRAQFTEDLVGQSHETTTGMGGSPWTVLSRGKTQSFAQISMFGSAHYPQGHADGGINCTPSPRP